MLDHEGKSRLYLAADMGKSGAALVLMSPEKRKFPLHIAAFRGHADILTDLIEHGAGVNVQDGYQQTAFLRLLPTILTTP